MGCPNSKENEYLGEQNSTPDGFADNIQILQNRMYSGEQTAPDQQVTTKPDEGGPNNSLNLEKKKKGNRGNKSNKKTKQGKDKTKEAGQSKGNTEKKKRKSSNNDKRYSGEQTAPDKTVTTKPNEGRPNESLNREKKNKGNQGNKSNKETNQGEKTPYTGKQTNEIEQDQACANNEQTEAPRDSGDQDSNHRQSDANFNSGMEGPSVPKTDIKETSGGTNQTGEDKLNHSQCSGDSTAPEKHIMQKPGEGGLNESVNKENMHNSIQANGSSKETNKGNDNIKEAGELKSMPNQERKNGNQDQVDAKGARKVDILSDANQQTNGEEGDSADQNGKMDNEQRGKAEKMKHEKAQGEKTSAVGTQTNQIEQEQTEAQRNTQTNKGDSEETHPVPAPRNVPKEKYEEMRKRCETAEKSVQNKDQELKRHKSDNDMKENKIEKLQKQITDLKAELKETHDRVDKTMKGKGKDDKSKEKINVATLQKEITQLQTQLTNITAEKQKVDQEYRQIKSEKDNMKKKNDVDLAEKVNEIRNLEKEKSDLLLRLSEMAGRRLTDNNPNIADLSDVNRPTKLAEQYAELYDNEWTDAYSYLDTLDEYKGSEISVITALLTMLSTAYQVSLKTAEKQLEDFRNILNDFHGNKTKQDQHTKDVLKQLKDLRKRAVQPKEELRVDYEKKIRKAFPKLDSSSLKCEALRHYLHKCLELSWLMAIQDPPVHLNCDACKKGDPFDKNTFKEYTQAGPFIKFTVWPAVFLEKGGALLCKGVVQCDKRLSGSLRAPAKTVIAVSKKTSSVRVSGDKSLSLPLAAKMDFGEPDKDHTRAETGTDKRNSKQQNSQTTEHTDTNKTEEITFL